MRPPELRPPAPSVRPASVRPVPSRPPVSRLSAQLLPSLVSLTSVRRPARCADRRGRGATAPLCAPPWLYSGPFSGASPVPGAASLSISGTEKRTGSRPVEFRRAGPRGSTCASERRGGGRTRRRADPGGARRRGVSRHIRRARPVSLINVAWSACLLQIELITQPVLGNAD